TAGKTSCLWRRVFCASMRSVTGNSSADSMKWRERLMQHPFPGNVRELDHVIERAVLMTPGPQIKANDLGLTTGGGESRSLEDMSLEEVEAFLIKKALARNNGNARKAAESLGLSRSAFYRRLQQYGL